MLSRVVPFLYSTTIIFTSFLFFLRIRAVFQRSPWIVAFFAGMWLAVLGGCLAFILDVFKKVKVNPALDTTEICFNATISPFIAAATIIPLINDTLIFIATTWRLSRNSYDSTTIRSGVRTLVFGDYLPVFSKVLLHDGQAYYLLAFLDLFIMFK
jgi:chromate transport protein ChrA